MADELSDFVSLLDIWGALNLPTYQQNWLIWNFSDYKTSLYIKSSNYKSKIDYIFN